MRKVANSRMARRAEDGEPCERRRTRKGGAVRDGRRRLRYARGIVQKCTFCDHRTDSGVLPACVETCLGSARSFGHMNETGSEMAQILASNPVPVLKLEIGTGPRVF